jgi:hypothetical protein
MNKSLEWLDKACGEHAGATIYLNIDRVYDPMRHDPISRRSCDASTSCLSVDESPEK